MQPPFASNLTLVMEILIAILIFFLIYQNYFKNIFSLKLTIFTLVYESIFNLGYMLYRTFGPKPTYLLSPALKLIAALHGILSFLIMLIGISMFLNAYRQQLHGQNYFRSHRISTLAFLLAWLISLLSGCFLYFKIYFF